MSHGAALGPSAGEREAAPELILGETGVGKTYQTLKRIRRYIQDLASTGKVGANVLILDFQNDYVPEKIGYHIPTIHPKHIYQLNNRQPGATRGIVRRIIPVNEDGSVMSNTDKEAMLNYAIEVFKNGLLVADDIDGYCVFNTGQDITSLLMGNRHKGHLGMDVFISHQSWGVLTTMECRNMYILRLHHVGDGPEAKKSQLGERFPICKIADLLVKQQYDAGNTRYFCYVNTRRKKIWGCSPQGFEYACRRYIYEYNLVKKELDEMVFWNLITPKDKKAEGAQQAATQRLLQKFNSFYAETAIL